MRGHNQAETVTVTLDELVSKWANAALGEQEPSVSEVFERWTVAEWRAIVLAEIKSAKHKRLDESNVAFVA